MSDCCDGHEPRLESWMRLNLCTVGLAWQLLIFFGSIFVYLLSRALNGFILTSLLSEQVPSARRDARVVVCFTIFSFNGFYQFFRSIGDRRTVVWVLRFSQYVKSAMGHAFNQTYVCKIKTFTFCLQAL